MRDIFGIAISVLIAMLSLAFTAWTPAWWICVIIAATIAVVTGIHIIWPFIETRFATVIQIYHAACRYITRQPQGSFPNGLNVHDISLYIAELDSKSILHLYVDLFTRSYPVVG